MSYGDCLAPGQPMKSSRLESIAVKIVAGVQQKLPIELRELARALPVHCERTPAPEIIAEGFPDDILGLFHGPAHGEVPAENPLPPRIILYLGNLWDYSGQDAATF